MALDCIGFTGTQRGMTSNQLESFRELLKRLDIAELHHGDCIGADAQAHDIAVDLELSILIHPPLDDRKRAFKEGGVERFAAPYLQRNHEMVGEVNAVIAAPKESNELLRSGTWATVRYAYKEGKPVYLVLPDGRQQMYSIYGVG